MEARPSMGAEGVGAIAIIGFACDGISAIDLIVILILLFGGLGLVLRFVKESAS